MSDLWKVGLKVIAVFSTDFPTWELWASVQEWAINLIKNQENAY